LLSGEGIRTIKTSRLTRIIYIKILQRLTAAQPRQLEITLAKGEIYSARFYIDILLITPDLDLNFWHCIILVLDLIFLFDIKFFGYLK
jgi:hypothetical protein